MKRPEQDILEDIRRVYRSTYPVVIRNLVNKIEEQNVKIEELEKRSNPRRTGHDTV
jgi:hypothetical protein